MHYNEALWVDYVRGLAKDDLAVEMQAHLGSGCRRCNALHSSLAAVEEALSLDRGLPVPEDLLARARAVFPSGRFSWRSLPREIASVVLDSFRQPALAGVRSVQDASRHLSFALGDYRVDLQVERQASPRADVVTGQLSVMEVGDLVAGVPVVVLDEEKEVRQELTNEFGEFHFDVSPLKNLRVLFLVENGTRVIELDL